jgi:hypothetical protein
VKANEDRQRRASLSPYFDPNDDACILPWKTAVNTPLPGNRNPRNAAVRRAIELTNYWVRIVVQNNGGAIAENCEAHLTGIDRWNGREWISEPFPGRHRLIWSYAPPPPVDIPKGERNTVDVFHCNAQSRRTEIQFADAIPLPVISGLKNGEKYRFAILISAKDAEPKSVGLGVLWRDPWPGDFNPDDFWPEPVVNST